MDTIIETPRLILRKLVMDDAPGMFELDSNPEVMTYIGTPVLTDIEQSREVIRFVQKQYEDLGIGRYAVILKESNEFLGWAGLKYFVQPFNNHVNFYDVGYRFIQRHWGKGYATEAAIASVRYGFEVLGADQVCGVAMPGNLASQAVLQKAGLKYIHDFEEDGLPLKWYEAKNPTLVEKI